jgi:hypothetical protein
MNTNPQDVQQILIAAIAHQIEHMSKEDLQAVINKALLELQGENARLKERVWELEEVAARNAQLVEKLEAEKTKLHYKIARLEFDPEEWENFDFSECTIPFEQSLAEAKKLLEGYEGDAP